MIYSTEDAFLVLIVIVLVFFFGVVYGFFD